jgi:hypothetical protein
MPASEMIVIPVESDSLGKDRADQRAIILMPVLERARHERRMAASKMSGAT